MAVLARLEGDKPPQVLKTAYKCSNTSVSVLLSITATSVHILLGEDYEVTPLIRLSAFTLPSCPHIMPPAGVNRSPRWIRLIVIATALGFFYMCFLILHSPTDPSGQAVLNNTPGGKWHDPNNDRMQSD